MRFTAVLLFALVASTSGFSTPGGKINQVTKVVNSQRVGPTTTELNSETSTGWDSFANARPIKDISYGEGSRKYRRTVYSHDDWKKHRSQDRFIYYLSAIFKSGVYKNLAREVIATTAIASFVWGWNILTGEYQDLAGATHAGLLASTGLQVIGLPLAPFTLASPSLGLLLGKLYMFLLQLW